MVIFNSDLDNTLIYSYKRKLPVDNLCVEMYHEREISFMTKYSYELLGQVRQKLCFVPTTTRTEEQYRRICLGEKEPEYALVCNGGVLLKDGVRDELWYKESLKLVSEAADDIEAAKHLLERDRNRSCEVKHLEGLFLFAKSSQPEVTLAILKKNLFLNKVDIFSNKNKIYVLPKTINKGTSALRLKGWLGGKRILAAGDSLMDISLLSVADRAIAPKDLAPRIENEDHVTIFKGNGVFSDRVLEFVVDELKESGTIVKDYTYNTNKNMNNG